MSLSEIADRLLRIYAALERVDAKRRGRLLRFAAQAEKELLVEWACTAGSA